MSELIALQINGQDKISENLDKCEHLLTQCRITGKEPALVVLPECVAQFACSGSIMLSNAETLGEGPIQQAFARMARRHKVFLVAGTMPIYSEDTSRYYACSLVFSPDGKCISHYNKMHLFDVEIKDNTRAYQESKYTKAGTQLSCFDSPWGSVGQAICYDLRFTNLFSAMMPVNIIAIPSAFTRVTGEAHWHALLRARSIETQSYVIAANQVGNHQDGRETFGHSCIYSPWGELLSVIKQGEGWASAYCDLNYLNEIRERMPVLSHQKERY